MNEMTELPLPFHYGMLLPFILAWRATPEDVGYSARCALVSAQLKQWGFDLSKERVEAAHEGLSIAMPLERPFDAFTEPLVAPDARCVVCRQATLQTHTRPAKLKV